MAGPQRRRGNTAKNKKYHRLNNKAKHYRRDHDLIFKDLHDPDGALSKVVDEDMPGGGRNYCISCARHFATGEAFETHRGTKGHKRRLKAMHEEPYQGL
jgi:bud site selection protein 20